MSGGLKIRTGGRATHSSDQFSGIDVTVTCESSKLIMSGQHRHAALLKHPSCCNISILRCERSRAGAELAEGTNLIIRAQGKEPSQWFASPRYPVQVWGARPIFIGYERARELTWFGTRRRPGQHRGIRPLYIGL